LPSSNSSSGKDPEAKVARPERPPVRDRGARLTRRRPSLDHLTEREREVVAGLVRGLTNKQIGSLLEISHRTVEIHRSRLMRKLGVTNLSALLEIAFQQRRKLPTLATGDEGVDKNRPADADEQ
jgi:DNA-binding NarL/FixJ family response regulator